jgi:hypothetical protein
MQTISLIGAFLILLPFTLSQLNRLAVRSVPYQLMNLLGSGLLEVVALVEKQYGFILLEGVWAAVSLWGLVKVAGAKGQGSGARG